MTRLTLREASRLISGSLSATRTDRGSYQIDAAELHAVSELLRAQLKDTREERDRWQQQAER